MRSAFLAVLTILAAVLSAGAQTPSFDCARASTAVEKAVCADPGLSRLEAEMAGLYVALAARLDAAAKDHLAKDQLGWLRGHGQCGPELKPCLQPRFEERIARLKVLGAGSYPWISERRIAREGKVKKATWEVDIRYPRFDGPRDFSRVNAYFADKAAKAEKEGTPDDKVGDFEQNWIYSEDFRLFRPGPQAITVSSSSFAMSGAMNGYMASSATLVDLRNAAVVSPDAVFLPGEQARRQVRDMVIHELRKLMVERPGFPGALAFPNIEKLLREPGRWLFTGEALHITFNIYEVGPRSSGPYNVDLPYSLLARVIDPDGPLGRKP